jgi:hypothetical protein
MGHWEIDAYSERNYAGDKEGRKSVIGMVISISRVPITGKSKGQPTVSLSSTESEYVPLCGKVRKVTFISEVQEFFRIEFN